MGAVELRMVEVLAVLGALSALNQAIRSEDHCNSDGHQWTYERIPGHQLQGYDQHQKTQSGLPIEIIKDCQQLCLEQRSEEEQQDECNSIDMRYGQLFANGVFDASLCYLSKERAEPEGEAKLLPAPGYVHYNKICLPKSLRSQCTNQLYAFERYPARSYVPDKQHCRNARAKSRTQCEIMCLRQNLGTCRSATYDPKNETCYLCSSVWRMNRAKFVAFPGRDYMENLCLNKMRRCYSKSHMFFIEEQGRSLNSAYKAIKYYHLTAEECKTKCVENSQIYCRAAELRLRTNSTGDCYLIEDDSLSVPSNSVQNSVVEERSLLMEFICLDSDNIMEYNVSQMKLPMAKKSPYNLKFISVNQNSKPIFNALHEEYKQNALNDNDYKTVFRRHSKVRLEGSQLIAERTYMSSQSCMYFCLRTDGCEAFTFSKRYDTCELYRNAHTENGADGTVLVHNDDYDYYANLITKRHIELSTQHTNYASINSMLSNPIDTNRVPSVGKFDNSISRHSGGRIEGSVHLKTGQFAGGQRLVYPQPPDELPTHEGSQEGDQSCYIDEFTLKATGRRVLAALVEHVADVGSLRHCERECVGSHGFVCVAFLYRYSSAQNGIERNCELIGRRFLSELYDQDYYISSPEYDFYWRKSRPNCTPDRHHTPFAVTASHSSLQQPHSIVNHRPSSTISRVSMAYPAVSHHLTTPHPLFLSTTEQSGAIGQFVPSSHAMRPHTSSLVNVRPNSVLHTLHVGAVPASESGFISSETGDVTASCDENGIEFTLAANAPFYGRIHTHGHYKQCSVTGRGERVITLRVTTQSGFPPCGTRRTGDVIQNLVVVQFSEIVQTQFDKRYNVTCYFQNPGEAVVTSGYISASPGQLTPVVHLPARELLDSRVRLSILYDGKPTSTIAVGDPLTFHLETQSGSNLITDIFASNVIARDPYTGRSILLIDRYGCPIDPQLFPSLAASRDGNGLKARFNAFKIPQSNYLLFEATVKPCRSGCRPARCSIEGRQNYSLGRRRRRRRSSNYVMPNNEEVEYITSEFDKAVDRFKDEETVSKLINVYLSRDEIIADSTRAAALTADGTSSTQTGGRSCVANSAYDYFTLIATCLVLGISIIIMMTLACYWISHEKWAESGRGLTDGGSAFNKSHFSIGRRMKSFTRWNPLRRSAINQASSQFADSAHSIYGVGRGKLNSSYTSACSSSVCLTDTNPTSFKYHSNQI